MLKKRRFSGAIICAILLIALVVVPMFAVSASAASTTVTKTHTQLAAIGGISTSSTGGSFNAKDLKVDDFVTVRFDKKTSTSNPAYYNDGVRLYQNGGTLTITADDATIKSVAITAGSSSYNGKGGSVSAGTLNVNSTAVTISNVNASSVVYTTGSTRLYVKSISITYEVSEAACTHANKDSTTVDATCTEAGSKTVFCADCKEVLSTESIDKLGHNYVGGTCSRCGEIESAEPKWVLTNVSDIKADDKVVIVVTKNDGKTYAMSNTNGTGSAPAAVLVTVSGDELTGEIAESVLWNITNSSGTLTIYPNGKTSTWLYCTSTNNGVRVGTNTNKTFIIDPASGYLKHSGTGRYLGVYNTQDWRCYTNTTGNIANQTLGFYVYTEPTPGGEPSDPTCEHINKSTVTEPNTCTEAGFIKVVCDDCGEEISKEVLPAKYHENKTETKVEATCTTDGSITVVCDDCGATLSTEVIPGGHKYADGFCTVCGEAKPIKPSSRYYIAAIRTSGNYMYMTNDLGTGSTKRYLATDSGLTTLPAKITAPEDGYVFVLEDNGDGTYCMYAEGVDGDNYLGWTSGNSGALVPESEALRLTLTKSTNGTVNLHFTASDGERYLALNNNSGNDYFAWYKSGQRQELALIPIGEPDPTEPTLIGGQVNVGVDLAIKYHVFLPDGYTSSDFILRITNGHGTVADLTVSELVKANTYVFTYSGIAPQCMSDDIDAELIYNGEVVDSVLDYSIVQYAKNLASDNSGNAELLQLLADLLAYGMAAQAHLGENHDVSFITADDIAEIGATPSDNAPDKSDRNTGAPSALDKAYISGAGVRFGNQVQIYVNVKGPDADTARIKVGGEFYDLVSADEKYMVYLPGMSITQLSESLTIELYLEGGEESVHTITYSAYAYVYQMIANDSETGTTIAKLSRALYNCAESAIAFAKKNA